MAGLPNGSLHIRHYVQTDDSVPRLFDVYYGIDGGTGPENVFAVATAAALAARDGMAGAMAAWLAGDSRYLGCSAHAYIDGVVGVAYELNPDGEAGELSGDTCPDQVAAVIRRYTIVPGPAGRGRVFIPAVAEINTDTSRLNEDGLAALIGIKDAMAANITVPPPADVGYGNSHYNRKLNQIDFVEQWLPIDVLSNQRRRRLRPLQ